MKNNLPYFSHYASAKDHAKFDALLAQYDFAGVGRFWRLNELVADADDCRLNMSKKLYFNQVAGKLRMSPEELEDFLLFLADSDACGLIEYENGIVTTQQTQEDLDRVMRKRGTEKARREAESGTNRKRATTNANRAADSGTNRETGSTKGTEHSTAHDTRSMHAAVSPQVLEEAVRGTPIRAGPDDLDRWTANLNAADLPADFVAWLYPTLQARPKVTKPAAICRTILDDLSKGTTEIREFQSAHSASPPTPSKPPPPEACDICGCTEIDEIDGQLRCAECARFWLLTNGEWIPDPDTGKPPDDGNDFETYQDTGKTPVGDDFPDDPDDFPGYEDSG